MELFSMFAIGILLILNAKPIKANYPQSDELTLRNQLLADVYFLKEGVDKLVITSEVLNKRFTNQMDILKNVQNKLINDNLNSEEKEEATNCDKITGMFNATLKKQNILETRLTVKLEELQEDQMTRFEEMLIKLRLNNKNCGNSAVPSNSLALLSASVTEVSEKLELFAEQITKIELLEQKFIAQQIKFDKYAEKQENILQQINEKLTKNHEQFEKLYQGLTNLKELNTDVRKIITQPRPKLPMEVILGITSANLTSFK